MSRRPVLDLFHPAVAEWFASAFSSPTTPQLLGWLVVQIEAPPSVASGLQRIGRAGHQAGAISEGIVVPKFRGDLIACAAVTRAMHEAQVESTRYPRNSLDVLAQQIVAMAAMDHGAWTRCSPVYDRRLPSPS